jgi:hypothetical protein
MKIVTGHELLRKLKKHGRVFFGASFTALKDPKQDIGVGLLHKMCRDLGIKPADL